MVDVLTITVLSLNAVFMLFAVFIILALYANLVDRGIAPQIIPLPARKSKEHLNRAQKAQASIDRRGGVNG